MLKRFYSKKSGFTLVEIVIAFAIFAIMASMIVQILDLSVAARRSNNIYQRDLAKQEKLLTIVQKTSEEYNKATEKGTMPITLGSVSIDLPYAILSADENAENQKEGLNYFLFPVDYQATGEISPSEAGGGGSSGSGSQASRMDTRLTGTGGIGYIWVRAVKKDEFTYTGDNKDYAVPDGCTRYYFRVSASSVDLKDNSTLANEDIGFSQYKMFFYDDKRLNSAASDVPYTDKTQSYKKNVPQSLTIARVGYVDADVGSSAFKGLSSSNVAYSTGSNNKYTIQQTGTNGVRIGTPYVDSNNGKYKGVKFEANSFSNFYIDFVGENVNLTTASFGYNGVTASASGSTDLGYKYANCPNYREEYDDDGTPLYFSSGDPHVNIYGAYLYTRNYGGTGGDDE